MNRSERVTKQNQKINRKRAINKCLIILSKASKMRLPMKIRSLHTIIAIFLTILLEIKSNLSKDLAQGIRFSKIKMSFLALDRYRSKCSLLKKNSKGHLFSMGQIVIKSLYLVINPLDLIFSKNQEFKNSNIRKKQRRNIQNTNLQPSTKLQRNLGFQRIFQT